MDFKAKFDKTAVLDFLKNQFLPDDFSESREAVKFSQLSFAPDRIKEIEFIGESSSLALKLYVIRHEAENDPRVTLSRETFRVMCNLGAQRALVVFYSTSSDNYRLSLATITLALKGVKTKREYSNPRRYSFFLGSDAKTHTPEQFLSRKVSDFDDLLKRFSIEVVNKEFYNEIAIKFTELVGGKRKVKTRVEDFKPALRLPGMDLSKPQSHIAAQEFAVRLIGRVVFCWFLKKKKSPGGESLLPESVLSSSAMAACDKAGDNYYHSVLENLFFQVLNTEMPERGKDFKKSHYDKIPFLNGGLFEPHDGDFYDFDAITVCSKHLNTLKIPNAWFKGLLDILETYNFTIDENTSVDVELAVDPEMLGRIFENLLAEINPETGETARKATGSYYTPRPIVEYMVDESLKQYLKTKTAIPEDKLSDLLSYSESDTDLSEPEKGKIIAALDEVKIIDPACGSGAFPMGMLQKIVLVLQKVDPDSKGWLSKLLDSVPDATARETLRKKLEGESDLWNYTRKLGVIRKSIYGVDIQPIAVEISKLRFFLSLVVDEKVDDKKKNRAIEPLPNLEFKFVCANTLIELPKDEAELFDDLRDIDSLKNLRDKYFTASGHSKLKVENEFLSTQHKMLMRSVGWGKADTKAMKLSQWEPFKNKSTGWFNTEWMFGLKDGFNIVVANPPYLNAWAMEQENASTRETIKNSLKSYSILTGHWDLYIAFVARGHQLLCNQGSLSYIVPNPVLREKYATETRRFLLEEMQLLSLLEFSDVNVFENVARRTTVLAAKKNPGESNYPIKILSNENDRIVLSNCVNKDSWIQQPRHAFLLKGNDAADSLLLRIEEQSEKIGNYFYVNYGAQVSSKVKGGFGKKEVVGTKPKGNAKQFYEGKDLKRWHLNYRGLYLDYRIDELYGPRAPELFEQPKIAVRKVSDKGHAICAALDDTKRYTDDGNVLIVPYESVSGSGLRKDFEGYEQCGGSLNLKYVLAVILSMLQNFYFKNRFATESLQGAASHTYPASVRGLLIKSIAAAEQKPIISLVDKIIAIKGKTPASDVSALEQEIDRLIYKLYGLTPEEIKIVESGVKK